MKILVLSYPYHGAWELCKEIAESISHTYIDDPLDLSWHGATRYIADTTTEPGKIIRKKVVNPRPYIYPNPIPDNSLTLHYVNQHKIPKNFTESEFLNDWVPNFDKVIILRSSTLDLNWKRWCAWKGQEHEDNPDWIKHLKLNSDYIKYEDSHYDQTCVDNINQSDLFLESYANSNSSAITTFMGVIQKQTADENNKHYDEINNELARWGIGIPNISYNEDTGVWSQEDLYCFLMGWSNSY